jgi:7-cyano-7-deazaguanine synthase
MARRLGAVEHRIMQVDLADIGGSALTDPRIAVPTVSAPGMPATYVPARNTLLLALALGWAEVLEARDLFVGVNVVDYSGYPDCRPEFIAACERVANLATRAGVEGARFRIHAPLVDSSKADIIREGLRLSVDFAATISCYQLDDEGERAGSAMRAACAAPGSSRPRWPTPRGTWAQYVVDPRPRAARYASRKEKNLIWRDTVPASIDGEILKFACKRARFNATR